MKSENFEPIDEFPTYSKIDFDEYFEDEQNDFPSLRFAALIFIVFSVGVLVGSFWMTP